MAAQLGIKWFLQTAKSVGSKCGKWNIRSFTSNSSALKGAVEPVGGEAQVLTETPTFCSRMRYQNLSPSVVVTVIKMGTLCRTLWPLFIPLYFYKYLRQVDKEMYLTELLYQEALSTPGAAAKPSDFYDASRAGWLSHWKLLEDLHIIKNSVRTNTELA